MKTSTHRLVIAIAVGFLISTTAVAQPPSNFDESSTQGAGREDFTPRQSNRPGNSGTLKPPSGGGRTTRVRNSSGQSGPSGGGTWEPPRIEFPSNSGPGGAGSGSGSSGNNGEQQRQYEREYRAWQQEKKANWDRYYYEYRQWWEREKSRRERQQQAPRGGGSWESPGQEKFDTVKKTPQTGSNSSAKQADGGGNTPGKGEDFSAEKEIRHFTASSLPQNPFPQGPVPGERGPGGGNRLPDDDAPGYPRFPKEPGSPDKERANDLPKNRRPASLPDLRVTRFELAGGYYYGQVGTVRELAVLVNVKLTVRNQGGATAGPFKIDARARRAGDGQFYLVPLQVDRKKDFWFAWTKRPLPPGAETTIDAHLVLDPRDQGKTIDFKVHADSRASEESADMFSQPRELDQQTGEFVESKEDSGRIRESNENNNDADLSGIKVPIHEADTDGDGLSDHWELIGMDVNKDGVIDLDLPAMGANPLQKDLFVEVDAMTEDTNGNGRLDPGEDLWNGADKGKKGNGYLDIMAPWKRDRNGHVEVNALDRVVQAYANANVLNPDGSKGINLHIQCDEDDIPIATWLPNQHVTEFKKIRTAYFGTKDERESKGNWAHIREAKKRVFRYCLFAGSFNRRSTSGFAGLAGDYVVVTLWTWEPSLPHGRGPGGGTMTQRASCFMHELGHSLGLEHGGSQTINYKPNYHSIMNYALSYPEYGVGWRLDYSSQKAPDLDTWNLDESDGVGLDTYRYNLVVPIQVGANLFVDIPFKGPVDWSAINLGKPYSTHDADGDGDYDNDTNVTFNTDPKFILEPEFFLGYDDHNGDGIVNHDDRKLCRFHKGHNDWAHIGRQRLTPGKAKAARPGREGKEIIEMDLTEYRQLVEARRASAERRRGRGDAVAANDGIGLLPSGRGDWSGPGDDVGSTPAKQRRDDPPAVYGGGSWDRNADDVDPPAQTSSASKDSNGNNNDAGLNGVRLPKSKADTAGTATVTDQTRKSTSGRDALQEEKISLRPNPAEHRGEIGVTGKARRPGDGLATGVGQSREGLKWPDDPRLPPGFPPPRGPRPILPPNGVIGISGKPPRSGGPYDDQRSLRPDLVCSIELVDGVHYADGRSFRIVVTNRGIRRATQCRLGIRRRSSGESGQAAQWLGRGTNQAESDNRSGIPVPAIEPGHSETIEVLLPHGPGVGASDEQRIGPDEVLLAEVDILDEVEEGPYGEMNNLSASFRLVDGVRIKEFAADHPELVPGEKLILRASGVGPYTRWRLTYRQNSGAPAISTWRNDRLPEGRFAPRLATVSGAAHENPPWPTGTRVDGQRLKVELAISNAAGTRQHTQSIEIALYTFNGKLDVVRISPFYDKDSGELRVGLKFQANLGTAGNGKRFRPAQPPVLGGRSGNPDRECSSPGQGEEFRRNHQRARSDRLLLLQAALAAPRYRGVQPG